VLSVNFRASTGFGKAFVNAGDREWAARMHDDLLDAVDWAVREKVTTADKVAIYGGSYGGYATLVGLTFTPDRFACGVDIVGPRTSRRCSPRSRLTGSRSSKTSPAASATAHRGRKEAAARALATVARRPDRRPLLIAQGANDPRVKQAESDQIVAP